MARVVLVALIFLTSCEVSQYQVYGHSGKTGWITQHCQKAKETAEYMDFYLFVLATVMHRHGGITRPIHTCVVYDPEYWGGVLANGGCVETGHGFFVWAAIRVKAPWDETTGPYVAPDRPELTYGDWRRTMAHESVHVAMAMWLGRSGFVKSDKTHTVEFEWIQWMLRWELDRSGVLED